MSAEFFEVKNMIYVAVGTQKFQFDRLIKSIDKQVENGIINEEVIAQIGYCNYKPVNFEYKDFLTKEEFDENIKRCDLLITHSGVGTIISGLKYKKPIIVMPRLEKYGEHVDNHQTQIANSFAEMNLLLDCENEKELSNLIIEARIHSFEEYVSHRKKMIYTIKEYIEKI